MYRKLSLAALFLAAAPTALSYCVEISGSGQTGFGVFNSWRVVVDDALICDITGYEGGYYNGPCGEGGSEGGTLEVDWTPIAGPFDATYCDETGRCTTVTFGDGWTCEFQNCCGGNIPCQCAICGGYGTTCV